MANALKMAIVQSIKQLHAAGWSQRRIARELEIDRGTVARYLRPPPPDPKPAIPPAGSAGSNAATFSPFPAPAPRTSADDDEAGRTAASNTAILPAGSEGENNVSPSASAAASPSGRPSQCDAFRELILAKLDQQLSAQRIWQDLVSVIAALVICS